MGRKYKRVRVLGRGSFGTAYLVRCRTDSRQYVLKRLDLAHMNKKEQDEAMNEARVLEKLRRHPNIIGFKEHFVEEARLCIVMDFADGGDLAQRIEAQVVDPRPMPTAARTRDRGCAPRIGLCKLHLLRGHGAGLVCSNLPRAQACSRPQSASP